MSTPIYESATTAVVEAQDLLVGDRLLFSEVVVSEVLVGDTETTYTVTGDLDITTLNRAGILIARPRPGGA